MRESRVTLALVAPTAPAALEAQHAPVLTQLARLHTDIERPDAAIGELLDAHDRSVVLQAYIREAQLNFELAFDASAARVRAERRVGLLLNELVANRPAWAASPGSKRSRHQAATSRRQYTPRGTLRQFGVSGSQASRWRFIAALPDAEFDQRLEAARRARRELSTQALARAGKLHIQPTHHGGRPRLSTSTVLRRILGYTREIKRVESPQEHRLLRAILDITRTWEQALARPDVLARQASCLLCARSRPAFGAPARCQCGGKWITT